jgi:AcrR family transcriptional regulator
LFAAHGYAGTSVRQIASAVGISESGIYAHFEGKRHIYETLFAETGPPVVIDKLISSQLESLKTDPQKFLRELGEQVIAEWDEPRARQFMSVFMREGAIGTTEGSSSLASVVEHVQKRFGEFFRLWMEEGLVRNDFSPEHLVWEMISPLANVRFLYLHAQATDQERQTGLDLAKRHIDYFITCVLTSRNKPSPKANPGKNKKAEKLKPAKQKYALSAAANNE